MAVLVVGISFLTRWTSSTTTTQFSSANDLDQFGAKHVFDGSTSALCEFYVRLHPVLRSSGLCRGSNVPKGFNSPVYGAACSAISRA